MRLCTTCGRSLPPGDLRCPNCGTTLPSVGGSPPSETLRRMVETLLREDRKIEAIRVYREETGVGLKEAKEAVEAISRGPLGGAVGADGPAEESALVELMRAGRKIEAIKRYREQSGASLAEAKRAVEALAARHGVAAPRAGCAGMLALMLALGAGLAAAAQAPREPTAPQPQSGLGERIHRVRSSFQNGPTRVRVLVPDRLEPGRRYPVVYVLPVEAGEGRRFGDGLGEVSRHGLPDRHQAIFVAPTFSDLPWYADHPDDPKLRQESYLLHDVIPLVEGNYPARRDPEGRLLLGFSKSGWGAFSLLLRHPDVFGRASAWDAPLMMDRPGLYGSGPIFGSPENFESYRLSSLLERQGEALGRGPRLFHLGSGNFREEHLRFEALMQRLDVPHRWVDGPKREHVWESGWVPEAVALLFGGS